MKTKLHVFSVGLFVVAVMLSLNACGEASVEESSAGVLQYLEGVVQVNGVPAEIGDMVYNGDVLTTVEGAFAEIQFGENRVLRAQENTSLTINAAEKTFGLEQGAMGVVQSKPKWFSRQKAWRVQTPSTVAAVRGTVYYVKVEDENSVYFCLCNGKIHLEDVHGDNTINFGAAHHEAYRFIRKGDEIERVKAPMLYHSDEDMESLASSVGVDIDWTDIPK